MMNVSKAKALPVLPRTASSPYSIQVTSEAKLPSLFNSGNPAPQLTDKQISLSVLALTQWFSVFLSLACECRFLVPVCPDLKGGVSQTIYLNED
jgi:hypothetical protein